jgi:energy-coupling factor transport system permease protein
MQAAGLYLPGDSPLHRWHPLTKASLAASAVPLAFLPWPYGLLALLPYAVLALAAGRRFAWTWLRRLVLVVGPVALSLVLVQGFFFPGAQEVLWQLGPLSLKRDGLAFAALIIGRLAVMVGAVLVMLLATRASELEQALSDAGLPRELGYIVLAAMNLIAHVQQRAATIVMAQQARALALEGSLWRRGKALLPLLGPLLLGVVHEAEARALALEARGFRTPGPKTRLRTLPDSPRQRLTRWLLPAASLALFLVAHLLARGAG